MEVRKESEDVLEEPLPEFSLDDVEPSLEDVQPQEKPKRKETTCKETKCEETKRTSSSSFNPKSLPRK